MAEPMSIAALRAEAAAFPPRRRAIWAMLTAGATGAEIRALMGISRTAIGQHLNWIAAVLRVESAGTGSMPWLLLSRLLASPDQDPALVALRERIGRLPPYARDIWERTLRGETPTSIIQALSITREPLRIAHMQIAAVLGEDRWIRIEWRLLGRLLAES